MRFHTLRPWLPLVGSLAIGVSGFLFLATQTSAAELARDPHHSVRLENDLLGVRVWGPATQPTFSLGRADIWDRRWHGDRQPLVTLKRLRELALAERLSELAPSPNSTVYDAYGKYDFPCPKPGAQLILGTPFATAVQVEPDGPQAVRLNAVGKGKRMTVRAWVALTRPLLVLECRPEGLQPGDFWVRVYRHRDSIVPGEPVSPTIGGQPSAKDFEQLPCPQSRQAEKHWGIVQEFTPELTFPSGFRVAAAATAIGVRPAIQCRQGENGLGTPLWAEREGRLDHGTVKRYKPINEAVGAAATASLGELPKSFVVLAVVATTQDSPNAWQAAVESLNAATALGIEGLRKEQDEALRRGTRLRRAQAHVDGREVLAAPAFVPPSLRKAGGYYGDVPLCSVGSTKFCFQDAGLWHDDFHLNEIRAEGMLTLGQFEELLPYCQMIRTLLPQAEENAREVYGLPGAMYPLVHFPLRCRGIAHTNLTLEQDMGLNGLVSKPLWLYFRYTGDKTFLREVAWPVLRQCARFQAAYLTEEQDGRLHLVPTVSPEHWGLTPQFVRNRDCTSALTLTTYLLRAAAAAAEILGEAGQEAANWKAAAGRLAPYPTWSSPAGPVWVDVAGAPPIEYNISVPLAPVFWGDDVGLDSPPETIVLARRTLDQIRVWEPHRGYLDAFVRPRLGIWRPGASLGQENLLLSYQSIRLFPAVPSGVEIRVQDFVAEGGFGISAVRTAGGEIRDVVVESAFGGVCRLANAWPKKVVEVTASDGKTQSLDSRNSPHLEFGTVKGVRYCLRPR